MKAAAGRMACVQRKGRGGGRRGPAADEFHLHEDERSGCEARLVPGNLPARSLLPRMIGLFGREQFGRREEAAAGQPCATFGSCLYGTHFKAAEASTIASRGGLAGCSGRAMPITAHPGLVACVP
jgi:hypothetical protein